MVYDPLYMSFKDKPPANPRYETLYNVLGRVNIKLFTGNFDSGNSAEKLRWENRAGARSGARVPGLEMPWNPDTNLALGPNDSNLY